MSEEFLNLKAIDVDVTNSNVRYALQWMWENNPSLIENFIASYKTWGYLQEPFGSHYSTTSTEQLDCELLDKDFFNNLIEGINQIDSIEPQPKSAYQFNYIYNTTSFEPNSVNFLEIGVTERE